MPSEKFADQLRKWRGKAPRKEAAYNLGIPYSTFRKYEEGRRTPGKLALAELERRMAAWHDGQMDNKSSEQTK